VAVIYMHDNIFIVYAYLALTQSQK